MENSCLELTTGTILLQSNLSKYAVIGFLGIFFVHPQKLNERIPKLMGLGKWISRFKYGMSFCVSIQGGCIDASLPSI